MNTGLLTEIFKNVALNNKDFYNFSMRAELEFKEFEPRFKSAKTRFKFSAGLNLETFDTILSGTNHI